MQNVYKFYFSLAILLSVNSITYGNDTMDEEKNIVITDNQEAIDNALFDVFHKFFDLNDQTPFTVIVTHIVELLKKQKHYFDDAQKIKCEKIIKIFEKNKNNTSLIEWAQIFITTNNDLEDLMSLNTREYINKINTAIKLSALRNKLQYK